MLFCIAALTRIAIGTPLTIDLRAEVPEAAAVDLGQGTATDPAGHTLTADSRSFLLDGKPWVPIVGEFHYARYPRDEWRDELLKMKAGGISVVSTYVFWIHHEEQRGQFDWTDRRSLHDFLQLCKETGLKSIVRMGPWAHGEVRNGGFPDWVQNSHTKLRSADPAFMNLVAPFYHQLAGQMKGLLWKDGGPVIGIQVDNECNNLPYLLALKDLARSCGVDVPFYTMTGWNGVHIPTKNLLPMFGGYADGFWGGSVDDYRKLFVFNDVRDSGDLGAQFINRRPDRSNNIGLFPYACCEIGGGMMSSYNRRIKIDPEVTAALAMVKLGCGNNMPGYYMFHGGINPDGKLSYLNESHPNAMPVKDYDFQAPLGACGEVREQFHLLREQHLFLEDFGASMARMAAMFPAQRPADIKDFAVVRWSVRWDGNAGFLFFNNRQPPVPLPDHPQVQFDLQTRGGSLLVPRQPIPIPSGSYGVWPINMDCDGVRLEYATAQPLCRMTDGNAAWYFLTASDGIAPEFSFRGGGGQVTAPSAPVEASSGHIHIDGVSPGLDRAISFEKADGSAVNFVVLSRDQAMHLWRMPFAGRERLALSNATVLADNGGLRLQAGQATDLAVSLFPPVKDLSIAGQDVGGTPDGIFKRYVSASAVDSPPLAVTAELLHPATDPNTDLHGTSESAWGGAAEWALHIPATAANRHVVLQIHYVADAARIYSGARLVDDNYFNGDSLDLALWRIPAEDWGYLRLKILPMADKLLKRLPESVRAQCVNAEGIAKSSQVSVSAMEQLESRVDPSSP